MPGINPVKLRKAISRGPLMRLNETALLLIFFLSMSTAVAAPEGKGSLWTKRDSLKLCAGMGVYSAPLYTGAGKNTPLVFPLISAEYGRSGLRLFAGVIDGMGVEYTHERSGLFTSLSFAFGESRDPSDSARLKGSAQIDAPVRYCLEAGYAPDIVRLSVKGEMMPARVRSSEADNPQNINCLRAAPSAEILIPLLFGNLYLLCGASLYFMDSNTADSWYSLEAESSSKKYSAQAGIEKFQSDLLLLYDFSYHISLGGFARTEFLSAGCADSPLSAHSTIFSTGCYTMYRF